MQLYGEGSETKESLERLNTERYANPRAGPDGERVASVFSAKRRYERGCSSEGNADAD